MLWAGLSNATNLRMQRGIAIEFIEFDLKAKWKRDWRFDGESEAVISTGAGDGQKVGVWHKLN